MKEKWLVNKWSNRTEEFLVILPPHIRYNFGGCYQDCVPAEHAWRWITSGKWQKNTDSIRSIPKSFRQDEPMIGLKTALGRNPLRVDRMGDASQTRVSVTRKTTGSGGQMTVGWNRTQPTCRKRRAGGRSAVKRIPDGTVLRRDNQWGIPRKRALFVSDGPDSTTSGSDILEGHYDRPPEEGYSDVHSTGRPHDVHVAEELCSPSEHLEKAVVRLQQDIADYRAELELNRTQTPAVSTRPPKRSGLRRRQFLDFQGSRTGSNIGRCLKPLSFSNADSSV